MSNYYEKRNLYSDQELIAAYKKYGSTTKAAEHLDVCYETIGRACKRNGVPLTGRKNNGGEHKKITDDQLIEASKIMTRQQIADTYGMHVVTVDERMRRLGIHAVRYKRSKKITPHRTLAEYNALVKKQAKDRARIKTIENEWYKALHTVERECAECGKHFFCLDAETRVTCSADCSRKYANRRVSKRIPKAQRIDNISLKKLYRRDKGTCYLCGKKCDWNDWSVSAKGNKYPGDTYPTIEHVIPVSKGGLNAWENVRLAHWKCNLEKSDELITVEPLDTSIARIPSNRTKPKMTAQYTLDGKLIKIWSSTAQIRRELGLNDKHIQAVCRKDQSNTGNAYGYHWEYVEIAADSEVS